MSQSTKPLVLLTGPTGFVGAHVLQRLLADGFRVRGTIRAANKADFLQQKYPQHQSDLSFHVVPDIQAPAALDEAVSDVDYICHVASPYFTSSSDPVKELIEPAVKGTQNVLSSALKAPNLKRLTVLSSFAAVVDLSKNPRAGYVYTPEDWDPVTMAQGQANGVYGYHASKTFAERAAWDMWKEAEASWDILTFCPPMIYGPPIHQINPSNGIQGLNTSLNELMLGITGRNSQYAPKVAIPGLPAWVDVRDVAKPHSNTLRLPAGTNERYIIAGGVDYFEDGLRKLRASGVKKLGEEGAKCDRNKHFQLDVSKAQKMLGLEFGGFEKMVGDVWARMDELGIV